MSKRKEKSRNGIGNILAFVIGLSVFVILAVLFVYYDRYHAEFTMTSKSVQSKLTPPFNAPLIESKSIALSGSIPPGFFTFDGKTIFQLHSFKNWTIPLNTQALIPYQDSPVDLRFLLPNYIRPLGGLWRGESAEVKTYGALQGVFSGVPGHQDKSWGTSLSTDIRYVTPYFDVTLPLEAINIDDGYEKRIITTGSQVSVTYI